MVRIQIDERETERNLKKALIAFAIEFSNKMADEAPFDQGELKAKIRNGWKVEKVGGEWVITFSMPSYAGLIETGTGIFGPTGRPIMPKTPGGVLAWKPGVKYRDKYGPMRQSKGEGPKEWYFFKWVRGMRAQPFIRPTFHKHAITLLRKNLRRSFK